MEPEHWEQVEHLYHAALEHAPDARATFLAAACADDAALRREVESLLACDDRAADFIEKPALEIAAQKFADEPSTMELGQRISHYQILSRLGKGGMGEVFLAQDTNLKRQVAIKLLPAQFTVDRMRVERFEREARAASALNHPNILTIHEIGQSATEAGATHFLVTEYIDGQTLRQQMKGAPMNPATALDVALQIAAALVAAHEAGIIHRDIKPENVMVRRDGLVKVLDFGLAKLTEQQSEADSSTATGIVMGTPRYMSPEQARGEKVDVRTDIFSFGVMLYEMIAGVPPFAGATPSETIAAILRDEPPPLSQHAPDTPPAAERIVHRALRKDRAARYQTAQELLADLTHLKQERLLADATPRETPPEAARVKQARSRWMLIAGVVSLVVVASLGLYRWLGQPPASLTNVEAKVVPLTSFPNDESEPAFSPDGNRIAFVWRGPKDDNVDIYLKQPGAEGLQRLTTDPAEDTGPAWSPDGRHLAFLRRSAAGSGIYLAPALGGGERKLAEVFNNDGRSGNTLYSINQNPNWSPDGKSLVIVDKGAPPEPYSIFALARESGEKRRLTTPPPTAYGDTSPAFSPDGKLLAFVRVPGIGVADVYLMPATGGEPRRLTFRYEPVGRVAWTLDSRAIVFDSGAVVGTGGLWRVAVAGGTPERIAAAGQMVLDPAVSSAGGRLAWTQSLNDQNIWRLELSNSRNPVPKEFIVSTRTDNWPEYSPDGKRILFLSLRSGSYEIWVCGTQGEQPVQLTELNAHTGTPHWSSDSRHIVFDSRQEGNADIYVISAEGGQPRRLTTDPAEDITPSWSRDGRSIWFGSTRSGSLQIWKMPVEGGAAVQMTKEGGFEGFESPDGQFFYYAKGRGIPGIWRIPTAGGAETLVLDSHLAGFQRTWKVVQDGIYFAATETPSRPRLEFFNFATGKLTPIVTLDKSFGSGLGLSPDGRWLLYTQRDRTGRDLMLMENFR